MQKESTTLRELTRRLGKLDISKWKVTREEDLDWEKEITTYSAQLDGLQISVSKYPTWPVFGAFWWNYDLQVVDSTNGICINFSAEINPFSRVRSLFYALDSAYYGHQRNIERQGEQANRTEIIRRLETALS